MEGRKIGRGNGVVSGEWQAKKISGGVASVWKSWTSPPSSLNDFLEQRLLFFTTRTEFSVAC